MTTPGQRRVPVPDGLDGERLDAALARLFGLSRARAAELISDGSVLVDGRPAAKSDRVPAGEWLDVTLPPPPVTAPPRPEPVPGLVIVYEDADIVVVDKPPGVAAHPTPGWTGPTVLQGLLAAGHTIATSGAAERQGIVHRLDATTSGLMVLAKSERAYSALKRAFRDREVDKIYHALVQGHPDPLRGTVDAPIARHPSGDGRFAVVAGRPPVGDALRHARGVPGRQPGRDRPGDRAHPPDPGAHGRDPASLRRRPAVRRRPGAGRAARPDQAVAARGPAGIRPSRATAAGSSSPASMPGGPAHALDVLRDES